MDILSYMNSWIMPYSTLFAVIFIVGLSYIYTRSYSAGFFTASILFFVFGSFAANIPLYVAYAIAAFTIAIVLKSVGL